MIQMMSGLGILKAKGNGVGTYCAKERGKKQKDREYASSGTGTTWCDLSTERKKRKTKNMKR
jgi:hypothetical protein